MALGLAERQKRSVANMTMFSRTASLIAVDELRRIFWRSGLLKRLKRFKCEVVHIHCCVYRRRKVLAGEVVSLSDLLQARGVGRTRSRARKFPSIHRNRDAPAANRIVQHVELCSSAGQFSGLCQ